MPTAPTLDKIVQAGIDSTIAELWTGTVGKVLAFDDTVPCVDVQPQVKRRIRDEDGAPVYELLPWIPSCPILYLGGGGFRLAFKINPGDTGFLLVPSSDIAAWLQTGGVSNPGDVARNHLSQAIFIPGLVPFSTPIPDAGEDKAVMAGGEIEIRATAEIKLDAPAIEAGGTLKLVDWTTHNTWALAVDSALTAAGFPPATLASTVLKTLKLTGG